MSTQPEDQNKNNFSFPKAENQVLEMWQKQKIFEKTLEKNKNKKPFIFYDGPPFATGLPHHGHLLAGTIKDIIPRFFSMKGYYVERRFGWDCHGLPIEHEIDKKLGMKAHEAVEKLGIAKYNDECRGIVQRFVGEWRKTVQRLGRWVDFDNDYKTMDTSFMESVWWVFKTLWDKDLVYHGHKILHFSTALGTPISNFEASQNYKDVQDPSITVLIELEETKQIRDLFDSSHTDLGQEKIHLAIWTTTPWTLPSNLGTCVHPDLDYSLVKFNDQKTNETKKFLIASARLNAFKKYKLEILQTCKGSDLKGATYRPLFPYFKDLKKEGAFQIFTDHFVSTESGTGIVHMAPSFGEEDQRIMKEAGVSASACPLDDQGQFNEEVPDYQGEYIKDADKKICKDLKNKGLLFEQSVLVHSYPFCPRSDTPLIYKSVPCWYINVNKIRHKALEANKKIHWIPEHLKTGRFQKGLENAPDWAVSRNRIWGTPLPIWINEETGGQICFGSIKELEERTGAKIHDLHREHIDPLTFSIPGEKGVYKRIPEVLDCWFESGSMPYAQNHYPFENKETFEAGFPAQFIGEGLDQTRGWFYTLTILSAALFDRPAFKNVIVNGMILASDGKKMSKRLKNYTAPDNLMEAYGADALRLFLINSPLVRGEELRFSDDGLKDMVRRVLLPWYNAFKFFQTYAKADQWNPAKDCKKGNHILDRWIISQRQSLVAKIHQEMDQYKLYNVVPALFEFIEDLTNWYIRLNRRRFWEEGDSDTKKEAFSTLYETLSELATLMAPFTPFLAEYTFQELNSFANNLKEESVHLCDYPMPQTEEVDKKLEDAVLRMQQLILLGRQKRNTAKIKVKTPIKSLLAIHRSQDVLDEIKKLEEILKIELNVKEVKYSTAEDDYIELFAKPNARVLGKRFGGRFKHFMKLIQELPFEEVLKLEEGKSITLEGEVITPEETFVFRQAKSGTDALSNGLISLELDLTQDQNLIQEGFAREIVNRIQRSRKEMDLDVSDRIHIIFNSEKTLKDSIQTHQNYIMGETLAKELENCENTSKLQNLQIFDIEGHKLEISIIKI